MTGAVHKELAWLAPDWSLPRGVRALATLRHGGVSTGPYASLNLARHVGDADAAVFENRRRLASAAGLPAEPLWLEQVHGTDVVIHDGSPGTESPPRADAAVAFEPGRVAT